jgi:hypothetical protein
MRTRISGYKRGSNRRMEKTAQKGVSYILLRSSNQGKQGGRGGHIAYMCLMRNAHKTVVK